MVEVQILGKSYPLCLTVAALDEINSRCGGLSGLGEFLDGKNETSGESSDISMEAAAVNTAWLLGIMIREGENNRFLMARLTGESTEKRPVPTPEDLAGLLTIRSAMKLRVALFQAVDESMNKEIEALYPKNVKDAEQE